MPRSIHDGRYRARATAQHHAVIAKEVPIEPERRNKVPNLRVPGMCWYICTTAPSRELSAAASVRRIKLGGETPFAAYVPCEFFWQRSVRSNLRVPRREYQRPVMRHYLFVGTSGCMDDDRLAALRERDIDGRNVHGLVSILAGCAGQPLPLGEAEMDWVSGYAEDEVAGRTNLSPSAAFAEGEDVRIGCGPFSGFLARFMAPDTTGELVFVELSLMGGRTELAIPVDAVHKAA